MVLLFLAVPWVCRHFVIVVFPDHTHYFCSNYAPGAKNGPAPGVARDKVSFQQIPFCKRLGALGPLGPLVSSIHYKKNDISLFLAPHYSLFIIFMLCPQRIFGRHIVVPLSVRSASCPVHISYIL